MKWFVERFDYFFFVSSSQILGDGTEEYFSERQRNSNDNGEIPTEFEYKQHLGVLLMAGETLKKMVDC
jgi:hypothetical protein